MKFNWNRFALYFFTWTFVYAIGLLAGLLVISYMPGEWKRDDLEYYAKQKMIEYTDNGRVSNWSNSCIAVIAYDKNGKFENFFRMDGKPFEINFLDQTVDVVNTVLAGENTLRLYPRVRNYSKLGYTSLIYIGIPMYDKFTGEISGAFFWIKDCPDMLETMFGYFAVYTLFALIIIAIYAISLHRERRIMQIPKKYVDNITHELKSPIASIKGLTEALSDGMVKGEEQTSIYYGMILKEANKQEKMIHEVLELSKLQNIKNVLPKSYVAARNVFTEDIISVFTMKCDLYDAAFIVDESIHQLPWLFTNISGVHRVLNILVNNSAKYADEGGYIKLSAEVKRKKAIICVSDNGKGISKEHLPHIFDRFYRGNRSDDESGSGLGLAIAKETLESMGETIYCESKEGEGTGMFFTVSLL